MAPPRRPLIERLWDKIEIDNEGCWIFTGYLDKDGYGRAASSPWEDGGRRWRGVHAWIWEHINGPIPEDMVPDHLCRVKACCNPEHLEIVTHQVNARRRSDLVTHCPAGHAYDAKNTYVDKRGSRACRRCHYEHKVKRRKRLGRKVAG